MYELDFVSVNDSMFKGNWLNVATALQKTINKRDGLGWDLFKLVGVDGGLMVVWKKRKSP